jgi:hypothetical protein
MLRITWWACVKKLQKGAFENKIKDDDFPEEASLFCSVF